mgnify:CR=1 FL=1
MIGKANCMPTSRSNCDTLKKKVNKLTRVCCIFALEGGHPSKYPRAHDYRRRMENINIAKCPKQKHFRKRTYLHEERRTRNPIEWKSCATYCLDRVQRRANRGRQKGWVSSERISETENRIIEKGEQDQGSGEHEIGSAPTTRDHVFMW